LVLNIAMRMAACPCGGGTVPRAAASALYLSVACRWRAGEADDGRQPASAWGVRARR